MNDMGATVLKIEPPTGDSFRRFESNFEQCNRGKQSVVLDITAAAGMAALHGLLAKADVFVTNVRLKGLERLGLDHAALAGRYPRLIYGHLTAMGLGGPNENDAGNEK